MYQTGFVIRDTHAKYESPMISYGKEVIDKVSFTKVGQRSRSECPMEQSSRNFFKPVAGFFSQFVRNWAGHLAIG